MIQTIAISLGIIAAGVASIVLIVLSGNFAARKRKKEIDALSRHLAWRHSISFTHRDLFANKMLALDEAKKVLVFIDNSGKIRHNVINLKHVSNSTIVKSGISNIETKSRKSMVSEDESQDFSLALIFHDGKVRDLPLYRQINDGVSQRFNIMNLAKSWKRKINSLSGQPALILNEN